MISQTGRYAFQILSYLVTHRDSRVRGDEIAAATGIPSNYLSKILNQLRKSGLVTSQKGWGGGFTLRDDAMSRSIVGVLEIFEGTGPAREEECVFGLPSCDDKDPCPLHNYWSGIREQYHDMLYKTTVADLAMKKR
jgi:Rrf2 family transcriptional regulator, iron-sulfur cluster assembly transcription factor